MTRIVARSVPTRAHLMLEQNGIHPLLARLYAARGIKSSEELDTSLAKLIPPTQMKGAVEAGALLADSIAANALGTSIASSPRTRAASSDSISTAAERSV